MASTSRPPHHVLPHDRVGVCLARCEHCGRAAGPPAQLSSSKQAAEPNDLSRRALQPTPFYACNVDLLNRPCAGCAVPGASAESSAQQRIDIDSASACWNYDSEKGQVNLAASSGSDLPPADWTPITVLHAGRRCPMRNLAGTLSSVSSAKSDEGPAQDYFDGFAQAADAEGPHVLPTGSADGDLSRFDVASLQSELLTEPAEKPVQAAAAVVLEDAAGRVLLTRRAAHMRGFPNAWVVPGGHVDRGEDSLKVAAIRELREETGIVVTEDAVRVLCAYESCSPVVLEDGAPRHRHLVMYLAATLPSESVDLRTLTFQAEEVGAAAWLDRDTLKRAFAPAVTEEEALATFEILANMGSADVPAWELTRLPLRALREKPTPSGSLENERISTGTRVMLQFRDKQQAASL